jgi:hypothetical protein
VQRGPDTGLGKLAKVGASLSFVMLALYVLAVWAMTTKPSQAPATWRMRPF